MIYEAVCTVAGCFVNVMTAVSALMKQTDELLKIRMDPLVRTLETSEPQFYSTYFAARVIKDLGLGTRPETPLIPENA